jgi:hypothetical protein
MLIIIIHPPSVFCSNHLHSDPLLKVLVRRPQRPVRSTTGQRLLPFGRHPDLSEKGNCNEEAKVPDPQVAGGKLSEAAGWAQAPGESSRGPLAAKGGGWVNRPVFACFSGTVSCR